MSNFIERRFKNIKTKGKIEFKNVVKTHMKMPLGGSGFEKQHQSNISIILGEPATGKTYQFKEYTEKNKYVQFISLITLKENDSISKDTQVVLIDSIDEALTQNNQKTLARDLKEYILNCQEVNPKVRFAISCRFLEWNEYFKNELKTIDKELREYEILPISKEDINSLLAQKSIVSSDFWSFIENNFLHLLLNNILITIYLIDNFKNYENEKVTYTDIYHDLSVKYLSEQGEDRENSLEEIDIEKFLLIASSLATYLLFNPKEDIEESSNFNFISSKLYKINGKSITPKELKMVLNSNLYKKNDNKFTIFHKSIQEYLMAYFVTQKNLNIETLKELFASLLRFYEEFEEVIVYLTNLQPELFNEFVEFDPFIFKRHPNLTKEQQEQLLLSILNKYKVDFSQVWGRWESFEGSTLVKFEKLDNLIEILEKHSTLEEHGYYFMKLLKNNYTTELKEFMFELFEKNLSDKESLNKIIRGNFIDNYELNLSLYKFLQEHNLLKRDTHTFMMSFEAELFSSLYGVKYKSKYGLERLTERTDIDFNTILPLLDFVPAKSLKYIAPYFLKEDAEIWFQYVVDGYNKDKYDYEYINWIVFSILNHCNITDDFIRIVSILNERKIFLHGIDKKEMTLNFQKIKEIFWEVYFETDILQKFRVRLIIEFYSISVDEIKEIIDSYPMENFTEKYVYFRLIENVDEFLMKNNFFKEHMEKIWKKHKEQQKQMDEDFRKEYPEVADRGNEEEKFLKGCIGRFDTGDEKEDDLYNIFFRALNKYHSDIHEMDTFFKDILSSKYSTFINALKNKFKLDKTYNKLKKELTSTSLSNTHSFMFQYLFSILPTEEIDKLIRTKKDYIKLFWHTYRYSLNSMSDYFIDLSSKYCDCFKLLTLHTLTVSLKESNNKRVGKFYLLIDVYKKLNKFNETNLHDINEFLKENKNIFISLKEPMNRETLLEVAILYKENFDYILELLQHDKSNMLTYLQYLLLLDSEKGLNNFIKIYNNNKIYRPWWIRWKNKVFEKIEVVNHYDKFEINSEKIELYKILILSIKKSKINLETIDSEYIETILTDYYDFFKEYITPKEVYSPDIYDDMYHFINKRWEDLASNNKYIEILNRLKNSKNKELSDNAKYALTKVYEQQRKDGNYPNSYYKEIFDKDDIMNKTTININGDKHNIAIDSKDVKQIQGQELESESEKWYQKWWFISLSTGSTVGVFLWWNFSLLYGGIGFITSFLIVLILFNPKRRFFRIALSVLGLLSISIFPKIIGVFNIPENSLFNGIVKFGESIPPLIIIGLLILSGFLFWLDHQENKK